MPDLRDVRGQPLARRALEIAAAGAHNLLMVGPPGVGKTMLARRLPGILPPLRRARVARGHPAPVGRRHPAARRRPGHAPAVPRAAPLGVVGGAGRRRAEPAAGRAEPREPRRAVPRRAARVPARRAGGAARPDGGRRAGDRARASGRSPTRAARRGRGHEPVPVRRRRRGCTCTAERRTPTAGASRPAARPHGHRRPPAAPDVGGAAGRPAGGDRSRRAARPRRDRPAGGAGRTASTAGSTRRRCGATAGSTRPASTCCGRAIDRLSLSPRAVDRSLRVARTIADLAGSEAIARRAPGRGAGAAAREHRVMLRPGAPGWPAALADLHDPPAGLYLRAPAWRRASTSCWSRRWSRSSAPARRPPPAWRSRTGWRRGSPGRESPSSRASRAASTAPRTRARSRRVAGRWPCSAAASTSTTRDRTRRSPRASRRPARSCRSTARARRRRRGGSRRRNRIVAALGRSVVVVEAARTSGALITAGFALEIGREVLAVPASPWVGRRGGRQRAAARRRRHRHVRRRRAGHARHRSGRGGG